MLRSEFVRSIDAASTSEEIVEEFAHGSSRPADVGRPVRSGPFWSPTGSSRRPQGNSQRCPSSSPQAKGRSVILRSGQRCTARMVNVDRVVGPWVNDVVGQGPHTCDHTTACLLSSPSPGGQAARNKKPGWIVDRCNYIAVIFDTPHVSHVVVLAVEGAGRPPHLVVHLSLRDVRRSTVPAPTSLPTPLRGVHMSLAPDRLSIGIKRHFTTPGLHPYDQVAWERRDARITNWKDGSVAFEQLGCRVPGRLVAQRHQHRRPEVLPRHARHSRARDVAAPGHRPRRRHHHHVGHRGRLLRRRRPRPRRSATS